MVAYNLQIKAEIKSELRECNSPWFTPIQAASWRCISSNIHAQIQTAKKCNSSLVQALKLAWMYVDKGVLGRPLVAPKLTELNSQLKAEIKA